MSRYKLPKSLMKGTKAAKKITNLATVKQSCQLPAIIEQSRHLRAFKFRESV